MVTTDGTPFGNLSLNVYRGPEAGTPLIFVHGVLRCWQDFRPLFPYFGYDWTCFALDHRGHGGSERAGGEYEVMHYVGDIVQFVETQFLDEFDSRPQVTVMHRIKCAAHHRDRSCRAHTS